MHFATRIYRVFSASCPHLAADTPDTRHIAARQFLGEQLGRLVGRGR